MTGAYGSFTLLTVAGVGRACQLLRRKASSVHGSSLWRGGLGGGDVWECLSSWLVKGMRLA